MTAPDRKPWAKSTGSKRTSTTAWRKLRLQILDRDGHTCYVCAGPANQVDHVISVAGGGTDDPANLAAMCQRCHLRKTSREGQAAAAKTRVRFRREPEPHPGIRPRPDAQ